MKSWGCCNIFRQTKEEKGKCETRWNIYPRSLSFSHFPSFPESFFLSISKIPHNHHQARKPKHRRSPTLLWKSYYLREDRKFMGNLFRDLPLLHDEGKTKTQCCESIDGSRPCEVLITWFRFWILKIYMKNIRIINSYISGEKIPKFSQTKITYEN